MRGNNVSLFTIVILQFDIYEAINVSSTIKGSNLKKKENNMLDLQYGIFFRLFFLINTKLLVFGILKNLYDLIHRISKLKFSLSIFRINRNNAHLISIQV